MEPTVVDRLHDEFALLSKLLHAIGETSLKVTADDCFRKSLLLTAASLFETEIMRALNEFLEDSAGGNLRVVEFVKRKALTKQYHTLFDWKESHAKAFFALFGPEFKAAMDARVKKDEQFGNAIAAFMELGRERNRLVHQNFGHFVLDKTADEIYNLYRNARPFVEELPSLLRGAVQPPAG